MKTFESYIAETKMKYQRQPLKGKKQLISDEKFQEIVDYYEMGGQQKLRGGKADKIKPSELNMDELRKGIDIEMEHVNDPYKAFEIAMDHVFETGKKKSKYYTELEKMERKLGQGESIEDVPDLEPA